jgi:hypothetical protein
MRVAVLIAIPALTVTSPSLAAAWLSEESATRGTSVTPPVVDR